MRKVDIASRLSSMCWTVKGAKCILISTLRLASFAAGFRFERGLLQGYQTMDEREVFGRRLHQLRKQRDLTQEALAQQAYCAITTIRKIEAGIRRPSRQLAVQFANCLGLDGDARAAFLAAARTVAADAVDTQASTAASIGSAVAPATRPRHNNLPVQPTPLLGRAHEVMQIGELLRRADARLVTLIGPGGTGKTRLAFQVAAELFDAFTDGVCFVNLAPISDAGLVAATIAQALGVREVSGQVIHETLQVALREGQLLLLLDNFEQVVAAAELVANLLAGCPQLNVLVTSRIPLHLRGEKEIVVPPLALPPPTDDRRPTTDDRHDPVVSGRASVVTQYPAVQLFVQRVQDVQPSFVVTNENAGAIAAICARLDGLPLAIELAAAHSKLLSPQALLTRLDDRLAMLTGGARDLPARQQTIRATIEWSYNLLSASEQALFARLGVFVGGCTLDAAERVLKTEGQGLSDQAIDSAPKPQPSVLDGIAALLDQSMLRQQTGADDEPRFVMLETIREYALDRLQVSGEAEELRRQHALYYLALAEQADPELRGARQKEWLDRLEPEHNNMRAALAWSRTVSDAAELNLRLCAALNWFWFMHGNFGEARSLMEGALEQSNTTTTSPAARARVLHLTGWLSQVQGDHVRGMAQIEASLALYREAGNHAGLAEALIDMGGIAQEQGDYERARQLHAEGLALYREQAHAWGSAYGLLRLGSLALDQGDLAAATARYQESLALFHTIGARDDIAWVGMGLGRVAYLQSDHLQATSLFEESLGMFQELGNRFGAAEALFSLGRVALAQQDGMRSKMYLAESLVLYARVLVKKSCAADCLMGLAEIAVAQKQPLAAARLWGAAEALREASGTQLDRIDRISFDRDAPVVQAALGEAAFAAAWAAGRALSLDHAVAEALGEAG